MIWWDGQQTIIFSRCRESANLVHCFILKFNDRLYPLYNYWHDYDWTKKNINWAWIIRWSDTKKLLCRIKYIAMSTPALPFVYEEQIARPSYQLLYIKPFQVQDPNRVSYTKERVGLNKSKIIRILVTTAYHIQSATQT